MNLLDTFDGRKYLFLSLRVVVEWCKFHLFSWSVKRSISFIRFKTFSSSLPTTLCSGRRWCHNRVRYENTLWTSVGRITSASSLFFSHQQAERKIDKWALPKSGMVQCWGVILTMSMYVLNKLQVNDLSRIIALYSIFSRDFYFFLVLLFLRLSTTGNISSSFTNFLLTRVVHPKM